MFLNACGQISSNDEGMSSKSIEEASGATDSTELGLVEVAAVTTPTSDSTPDYTFSSVEAGTISYGGSCSSSTTMANSGNNTITLNSLSDGTYSDCTIAVRDNSGSLSNTLTITSFTIAIPPTLAEVTAVTTPTKDDTPDYTFSSDEAGTITYGGSCSSVTTSAISGNNTITLVSLSAGTYSDCTVTVTDSAGNSTTLNISSFKIKWMGTKQLGTSSNDNATGVATDSSDNVYVTGNTGGGLDGNTSAGNGDLYVVKYNSSGTKQWTKQLGTSGRDTAYGVATDSSDNVYVTGNTNGGLDGNTSAGYEDLFVVKYNSDGVKQ